MDKIKNLNITLALLYMIYLIILFILLPAGYAAPQRVRFRGRVPRRCAGAEPLHQSRTKLLSTPERGERGGAAAAPAGRRLPQEARVARSLGKSKACFKPCFEDVEKKQRLLFHNAIYYILQFIFIPFIINTFSTPFTQDLTHNPNNGGSGDVSPDGVQGQSPCINSQPNSFSPPRPQFYFGAFLFFTYCGDYTYMVIYV